MNSGEGDAQDEIMQDVRLNLTHAKIGTMVLIDGSLVLAHNGKVFTLELNHQNEDFEITIPTSSVVNVIDQLDSEQCIQLRFRPKEVHNIAEVIKTYDFVFQMSKANKSELDFHLFFKEMPTEKVLFLKEFFRVSPDELVQQHNSKSDEEDVIVIDDESVKCLKRKKLYNPEIYEQPEAPDLPQKRQRRNTTDQPKHIYRTRNNSKDQAPHALVPPASPPIIKRQKSRDPTPESTMPKRELRAKTRANYAEPNNLNLEAISEEQQFEEALRRSIKTHKKENPDGIVFEKEEQSESILTLYTTAEKSRELFTYPTISQDVLMVTMEDYLCLSRKEYLSDVDIDFFIQYLYNNKLSPEQRERTYIFRSHFYGFYATSAEFAGWKKEENAGLSAAEKRYLRVNQMFDDVNLFEKDFLVIPLMDHNHWFLAIVCYPGLNGIYTHDGQKMPDDEIKHGKGDTDALPPLKVPCILIFDSIASGNVGRRTAAIHHIRNFLISEHEHKYKDVFHFNSYMIGNAPRCPLQSNNVDCGCFVLEFVERFFVTAPVTNFRLPLHLNQWFNPKNVGGNKRSEIAQVFNSLLTDSSIVLPELEFVRPRRAIAQSKEAAAASAAPAADDDSKNNNNNNDIGNEEFNNNNFNCRNSNNEAVEPVAVESLQEHAIGAPPATDENKVESTFSSQSANEEDNGMTVIQENIVDLLSQWQDETSNQNKCSLSNGDTKSEENENAEKGEQKDLAESEREELQEDVPVLESDSEDLGERRLCDATEEYETSPQKPLDKTLEEEAIEMINQENFPTNVRKSIGDISILPSQQESHEEEADEEVAEDGPELSPKLSSSVNETESNAEPETVIAVEEDDEMNGDPSESTLQETAIEVIPQLRNTLAEEPPQPSEDANMENDLSSDVAAEIREAATKVADKAIVLSD